MDSSEEAFQRRTAFRYLASSGVQTKEVMRVRRREDLVERDMVAVA